MQIHESAEDYLETILMLEERGIPVRSIDIVNELHYSKPSVSIAMKKLRENGCIRMDPSGRIVLLAPGRRIAEEIWARHRLLASMLMAVGVSEQTAARQACRIEHDIDDDTYQKLYAYYTAHMAPQQEEENIK
ncbi:MAG: metal-dependent transcriptional regulator [Lachnospiraceae bacterium]|nr:metal-dependent transcriptional regulator [Lachnospiraceae bacterium]MCI1398854.1 metal-dependent transcriptional regulator [Lachnospiraceae bacterium]MCI1424050.1 metal-dependent transcriptional regulator [Lachnospiraceae bacterium]MCI1452849.1 metal-dependent transcriptional regulator [Lachnospiraceae bacterium]MDD5848789.1 metal-dependent transcriptional regulator [Bacillota bacterium]